MDKNNNNHTLPKNTMEIPTPKPNAQEVVGLVKENSRIIGYKLSSGKTVYKKKKPSLSHETGKFVGLGLARATALSI